MRPSIAWVLLVFCIGYVVAGSEKALAQGSNFKAGAPSPADSVHDADRVIARGIAVYREQLCGICHHFGRVGTKGAFGPPHDDFAAVAAQRIRDSLYTGTAGTPGDYIRESIVEPAAFLVPGYASGFHQMPPYIDLEPSDLDALIQLLLLEE